MRMNASIVIDRFDRPVVTPMDDDHDCLDLEGDRDEPWLAIDIGDGVSLLGPKSQIARWVSDVEAAVRMA